MKIKSYFASSVEQAIHQARVDLGTEAMLVASRRASREAQHLGAYEVVFGLPAGNSVERPEPAAKDLSEELRVLRAQLDDIKQTLRSDAARASGPAVSESEKLYRELVVADLDTEVARQIRDEACTVWQAAPAEQRLLGGYELLRTFALECIRRKQRFAQESGASGRVVIFVGAPGAGKTTTLAKVAVREYIAQRRQAHIISVDPYRAAAHEKLRTLAAILGLGFSAVNTVHEFIDALIEFREEDAILIDTPGYSAGDVDNIQELADVLTRVNERTIHLVLPASMKRADLTRSIRRFEEFKPDYLLFTKLDETESLGAILSTALEADQPLSYLATGQGIPEDLEPANAEILLDSLFRREHAEAVAAA